MLLIFKQSNMQEPDRQNMNPAGQDKVNHCYYTIILYILLYIYAIIAQLMEKHTVLECSINLIPKKANYQPPGS